MKASSIESPFNTIQRQQLGHLRASLIFAAWYRKNVIEDKQRTTPKTGKPLTENGKIRQKTKMQMTPIGMHM